MHYPDDPPSLRERIGAFPWPWKVLQKIADDVFAIRMDTFDTHAIVTDIKEREITMAVNVDKLTADVQTLAGGYQALQAENAKLKDELANADADAQARVDAAVAAEDADAQSKIDAADQVVADVLSPPVPDNPPADS